jgi:cell division protein FtsN
MVDFGRNNRGDLQPTRSLPLSALHARERSDVPQQRRRSRRIPSDNHHHHSSSQESPNPYSSRSEAFRTRSQSYDLAIRSSSSSSSSSSSKYEASRFRMVRVVLATISLLMVGFGGGLIYNKYNYYLSETNNVTGDANVATDELVKKLARENQAREQEIDALKRQVEEAKKRQSYEEQNNEPTEQEQHQQQQQPQFVAIGRYDENGVFHKYKEARPVGGGLRASNRMELDHDHVPNQEEHEEDFEQWSDEHEKLIDNQPPNDWDRQQEQSNEPNQKNDNDPNRLNDIPEHLCIQHPLAQVQRICRTAHNVESCLREGCKGPEAAERYVENE